MLAFLSSLNARCALTTRNHTYALVRHTNRPLQLVSSVAAVPLVGAPSSCLLHSSAICHGTGGSQSSRANRASSRASGDTYRTPKGRPGPNVHHVKEPLPEVRRFADATLPKGARRKQRAQERQQLPKHDRIDFSITGGVVGPLIGQDSQRKLLKRVKTPVHKQLRRQKAEKDALEWNEQEQLEAEAEADRFLALQASDRAALTEMYPELSPEEIEQLLASMDEEVEGANQTSAPSSSSSPTTSRNRSTAAPEMPKFGVQTVLQFLKEFDLTVTVPTKGKRGKKDLDAATASEIDDNPLNQPILIYDVISRFSFADFIIVVKSQSARQMRHLAESTYKMSRALNACGENPRTLSLEGRGREDWMLLDTGRIWIYFFNVNPAVQKPNGQGIFGVSFHVPQPKVEVRGWNTRTESSDENATLGVGQARLADTSALQNNSNQQPHTVTFSAHSNPFDPLPGVAHASPSSGTLSSRWSATSPTGASSYSDSLTGAFASSSSSSSSDDPDFTLHETTSQINSTMWYEPTPDRPASKKKSQINQSEQQRQMETPLDSNVVDAEFTATSTPLRSSSAASSSSSSLIDPSLSLLHASKFIHPVLENLEKTYGDLRVPTGKVSKLKDYVHEDLKNDVVHIRNTGDATTKKRSSAKSAKRPQGESIEIQDAATTIVAGSETSSVGV